MDLYEKGIVRNVRLTMPNGRRRRTTVRLEPTIWEALEAWAADDGTTVQQIIDTIAKMAPPGGNVTSAVRVALVRELMRQQVPRKARPAHPGPRSGNAALGNE